MAAEAAAVTPRGAPRPQAIEAKNASKPLQPLNNYDRHRVKCTCDDKAQASRLSGHTWNIINNREDHEVYLRECRNDDHYIDSKGKNTNHWFEKKRRIDLDGDGVIDCVDSSNFQEVMVCPPTAGKEAAHLRSRQVKQLCQASAPVNYGTYSARRGLSVAPPTPGRGGDLARSVPFQDRLRDPHMRPTPRVVERQHWTPRRGEPVEVLRPPADHEMYRTVDQLRVESHFDVVESNFADSLHSARRAVGGGSSSMAAPGASALSGATTIRSQHVGQQDKPPKPAADRHHSSVRVEASASREISGWPFKKDKLQREDHYHLKPMQQAGNSSVKYDIISNERRQFWY